MTRSFLPFLPLTVVLAVEGLGIDLGRNIVYYVLLLIPLFLYVFGKEKANLRFPKKATIIFILFLAATFISTLFSQNVRSSFEYLLLYISIFIAFVYFYNKKGEDKLLIRLLLFLSVIFSLASIFLNLPFIKEIFAISSGYQFVISRFLSHNHLGDFLILPLIILFYYLLSNRNYPSIIYHLSSIIFFLPYFLFSYSRSAYFAFFISAIFMFFWVYRKMVLKTRFTSLLFFLFTTAVCLLFIFITVKDFGKNPVLERASSVLKEKHALEDKYFLASRNILFSQALLSIKERPLFGVGPGNFLYASIKHTKLPSFWSETSHNIFLEMFVENGILAGMAFIAFIALSLKGARKNLLFFLAVGMLLNFQTDYTYRIYSFLALFFVILGINYEEKEALRLRRPTFIFGAVSFILAIFVFVMALSTALQFRNSRLAFYIYPLNRTALEKIMDNKPNVSQIQFYTTVFKGDARALRFAGNFYLNKRQNRLALEYHEKAFEADPFHGWNIVLIIYDLKKKFGGEAKAKVFADRVFQKIEGISDKWAIDENFRIEAMKLCQNLYNLHCPYGL